MSRHERDKQAIAEQDGDGPIQQALGGWARQWGLTIVAGTMPMRVPGETRVAGTLVAVEAAKKP